MARTRIFTSTTLAFSMFGKEYKNLTPDELRQYNRERKKLSRNNPEIIKREREYHKEWVNNNRDHVNEYKRNWRAGKKCQTKTN